MFVLRRQLLLNSFAKSEDGPTDDSEDTDIDDDTDAPPHGQYLNHDPKEARLEARELRRFFLAKSLFDCREFDRCAAVFLPTQVPHSTSSPQITSPNRVSFSSSQHKPLAQVRSNGKSVFGSQPAKPKASALPKNLSQKALFLALYARYMSGEKRKNEDSETILGPADGPVTANKGIPGILALLEEYFNARGGLQDITNSQGWLDYLYGIALLRTKSDASAKQWLLRSVNLQPYNWSAWLELASLVGSPEEMQQFSERLPRNIMSLFFHIHCSQELSQQTPEVFNALAQMESIFPRSAFLQQQKAMLHYHGRDHESALQIFDTLLKEQPYRLDGMEIFSNLLYVLPNRPKLATLASIASDVDKFRPETNCILGNYYSLISEHEKAVLHFRRALTLDRNFQAAWTLMGHEYIELKNTQAAIESYRRAVDTNRKDYRAWYGLGQGYEMLECHSYSLFYYQRAAALYPGDPKMWAAVGNAYAKCNKTANAIQAFKRALVVGSHIDTSSSFGSSAGNHDPLAHAVGGALDPQILYEIACLYEKDGAWDEAAAYMELTLAQEEGAGEEGVGEEEGLGVTQVTCRARLWLARFCYARGEWARTMELANELCQDGWEVEEAKGLVRDVRGRLALAEEEEVEG
ncbi:Anaphase-promoting complex subunit 8 [Friedmanniomyces endolithicus]|nr:Anaphase-promoting complex subunit 8 [Friedmanniomyces endolithicus]KAK0796588.1 Anaphase-promoting complex subunit 8 [Friedmanniomyces endolithicus]KAK0819795.1 Anaphase-promoting complex subunit 8 [Friedmanniomyces endolithicus]KAK0821965.1 Anaphase-promoting complex subunit 8 [Friedmanniomyces endolithicus]KAK0845943.1 Anaphase-promoting complex subunit 8 [Friedmanniomyces endolithicus]